MPPAASVAWTALAAARDGARLVLTDLRTADLDTVVAEIEGAGGTVALSRAGDVSDYEWVKSFGAEVDEQVGTMDVVMNVAGISAWGTVENPSTGTGVPWSTSTSWDPSTSSNALCRKWSGVARVDIW